MNKWYRVFAIGTVCCVALLAGGQDVANAQSTDSMLTTYIDGLNANMPPNLDANAVASHWAEDGVHASPLGEPPGGPQEGREAIAGFFSGFDKIWVDWTHIETRRTIQDSRAVWEGVGQGTHKETGKSVELPIVFSIDFDDQGKIKEKRAYVNVQMIGEQIK